MERSSKTDLYITSRKGTDTESCSVFYCASLNIMTLRVEQVPWTRLPGLMYSSAVSVQIVWPALPSDTD